MPFFEGVDECLETHGGAHPWNAPEQRTLELTGNTSWAVSCSSCSVTAWGDDTAQAQDHARLVDRGGREGDKFAMYRAPG